ncbi:MAG: hypothetical protein Q8M76_18660, partial [Spirochaetaceae bacterium]|nr:hypothetical protein [Spirochaetaceae bacterium]
MPERPSPIVLALIFAFASIASAVAQAQAGTISEPTLVSSRDVVLRTGEGGADFFRFLPDGDLIAFDRNNVLSAALGDSRSYAIE